MSRILFNLIITVVFFPFSSSSLLAQRGYWQNRTDYTLNVSLNTVNHQFDGTEKLVFTNHSPDTITDVFYHLYFNAFQPESMMDIRSRNSSDPDSRVRNKIGQLKPHEIGRQTVSLLAQDGVALFYTVEGTLLKATLAEPLLPGEETTLECRFSGQVPVHIRRAGRDNAEGVDYSMAQWYPKLAVYDREGWHPDPYVAREFFGEFGTFDVRITLPQKYTVAATGMPQKVTDVSSKKSPLSPKTWHFIAENVHDFVWAADPEFVHTQQQVPEGPLLHFYHLSDAKSSKHWDRLAKDAPLFFAFMAHKFGPYAYPQFSVIQGGDGGMEYPMATLMMTQGEKYNGFLGLFVHEACHSWYYGMIATNEQAYPWMDEGFATFAEDEAMNFLTGENKLNAHESSYSAYLALRKRNIQEPLTTPADLYHLNRAYSVASYSMGSLFLVQLRAIIGEEAFWKTMRKYYDVWNFKHPRPEDFLRVAEKESGQVLDWYLSLWTGTTKGIDYGIQEVRSMGNGAAEVIIQRIGEMPMPLEVRVTLTNGAKFTYSIPLTLTEGGRKSDPHTPSLPWAWTHPTYALRVGAGMSKIAKIELDPVGWLADVDRLNNVYVAPLENDPASQVDIRPATEEEKE